MSLKSQAEPLSIAVIGLGYIGLPTAALLANRGFDIIGVDTNPHTVEVINQGKIHILEPDLDTFVRSAVHSGRLRAFTVPQTADVFMICVPTPFAESSHDEIPAPDLSYVMAAVDAVAPLLNPGNYLILESTSPVGTTEQIRERLISHGKNPDQIYLAYCPERVLPGNIMVELLENDRIVGGINPESGQRIKAFYERFIQGRVLVTDSRTAELCKLVENTYRDVSIAFANELSMLADNYRIDIWELIRLANHHPRVKILQPGVGVGGHCIAVDPWFIISQQPEQTPLMLTARKTNLNKTRWVIEQIEARAQAFQEQHRIPPRIACLGLAFKPNIDDLRESPALEATLNLQQRGWSILAVEPHVQSHDSLQLYSLERALELADIVVCLVNHRAFHPLPQISATKQVMDFCGLTAGL